MISFLKYIIRLSLIVVVVTWLDMGLVVTCRLILASETASNIIMQAIR